MTAETVIRCENLGHVYPNGVKALDNITLEIRAGDYVALVGQNGSGKTTLAKHLNGLLKPTQGTVSVFDMLTSSQRVSALARRVGYVFQNPDDMLFSSSVEEEIGYGLKMKGVDAQEIRKRVDEVIRELNLEALREEHPFALSLGDRQRVAVACVLCVEPDIFVCDEPTTGQDSFGSENIMSLIDHLHRSGKTVIFITHDMPIVAEHALRVVVLNSGRIALDGTPADVFSHTDQLKSFSLRPPQVTRLAQRMSNATNTILNVPQMTSWLQLTINGNKGTK